MASESVKAATCALLATVAMLTCMRGWAQNDKLDQALDLTQQTQRASAASQQRIDRLDDQTRQLLERYRNALWQSQQLKVYAQQIEELSKAQIDERESLKRQIAEMERVERELLPMMLRMIDSLDSFVKMDLPFLQDERAKRVANLRKMMADPEVGTAEKFQRIVEAYRTEVDYGNTLGAERVEIDGRVMDQLRVGRTALFALALDGDSGLRWDAAAGKWVELHGRYVTAVRQGLKIARETAAPELLVLPMPTATSASAASEVTP